MKIRKQLKREKSKRKNIIFLSVIIMILMPYLVAVLNDQGIFKGWEIYFAFSYTFLVDLLLFLNILRLLSEATFEFHISNQRIKIKDSFLKPPFTIQVDRILYIDELQRARNDFEILIIIEKGKRNKKFSVFDKEYVKFNTQYKPIYSYILSIYPDKEFYSYSIRKAGVKKFYYAYLLYKNAYNAKFSSSAIACVKRFVEEYNLS